VLGSAAGQPLPPGNGSNGFPESLLVLRFLLERLFGDPLLPVPLFSVCWRTTSRPGKHRHGGLAVTAGARFHDGQL